MSALGDLIWDHPTHTLRAYPEKDRYYLEDWTGYDLVLLHKADLIALRDALNSYFANQPDNNQE